MTFRFWRAWLQCVFAASAAFGFLLLIAPDSAWLESYNQEAIDTFFPTSGGGISLSERERYAVLDHHYWALAVMGSVTAAWAILLLWVATVPFGRRERWAWQAIAVSVLVWAIGDSVVSGRHWLVLEVLWNLILVALIALPLAMTYRSMKSVDAVELRGCDGDRDRRSATAASG